MNMFRKFLIGTILALAVGTGISFDSKPAVAAQGQLHLGPYHNREDAERTAVLWRNLHWKTQIYYVHHHPSGPGWILHVYK